MKPLRSVFHALGFRPKVSAIKCWYSSVHFASTLEADWAATFDMLGISWSYEPIGLRLSDGQLYRCDFWLPGQRVWCEVKGPHEMRIDKPRRLALDISDVDDWRQPLVAVCRIPVGPWATIERADGSPLGFAVCGRCDNYTIIDLDGAWQCRVCGFWERRFGGCDPVPFVRTYVSAERGAA